MNTFQKYVPTMNNLNTMKSHNMRESTDNSLVEIDVNEEPMLICESEVTYLINLLKNRSDEWDSEAYIHKVIQKAGFTAKLLTQELIEGKNPICKLVDQLQNIKKENAKVLLYRCKKLYQAKVDATKILNLIIKLKYDPQFSARTNVQTSLLLRRI